jgi:two-component system, sensor histidine kinase LadS
MGNLFSFKRVLLMGNVGVAQWLLAGFVLAMGLGSEAIAVVRCNETNTLQIESSAQRLALDHTLEVLEDPKSELTIESITSPAFGEQFKRLPKGIEGMGFRTGSIWVRLCLQGQSQWVGRDWILQVNHPNLDRIVLYRPEIAFEPTRTVWLASNEVGDVVPFANREIEHRIPAFQVQLNGSDVRIYYLRMTTIGSMSATVDLISTSEFQRVGRNEYFFFGAYFGGFAVLTLYNLSMCVALRRRVYAAYFVAYGLIALLLSILLGLAFQYLWPDAPRWANVSPSHVQSALYAACMWFLIEYLDLKQYSRLYLVARTTLWIALGWSAVLVVLPYNTYTYHGSHVVAVMTMLVMVGISLAVAQKRVRAAYFYVVGAALLVLGALVFLLNTYGITLAGELSRWGLLIGALVDAAIVSMGLSDRIALLRKSEEAAQAKTLQTIRDAEQTLEGRVRERTLELEGVNKQLSEALVAQSRIEAQLRENEEAMRFAAHHDSLTALPNRALLTDRLKHSISRAKRDLTKVAVMMIDLDNFKQVNDSLGHSAGDFMLTSVANRLQSCLRQQDTVARFGGDEFVVIVSDLRAGEDALPIAQKLLESLRPPISIGTKEITTSGSIGIAIYPDHAQDDEFLLRAADKAMYVAKGSGRNQAYLAV